MSAMRTSAADFIVVSPNATTNTRPNGSDCCKQALSLTVPGLPRRLKKKEKNSIKRQAEDYSDDACSTRMPLGVAEDEIYDRAEREER